MSDEEGAQMDPVTLGAAVAASKVGQDTMKGMGALARDWIEVRFFPVSAAKGQYKAAEWVAKQEKRVARVAEIAEKIDSGGAGAIPERVAKSVFDEAAYTDNEYVQNYLGGILASARSGTGEDDSGVTWTTLIGQMSSLAISAHYVIYSTIRPLITDAGLSSQTALTEVYAMPFVLADEVINGTGSSDIDTQHRLSTAMWSLQRLGLLSNFGWVPAQTLPDTMGLQIPEPEDRSGTWIIIRPTYVGFELFSHGLGKGKDGLKPYFDANATYRPRDDWEVPNQVPKAHILVPQTYGE